MEYQIEDAHRPEKSVIGAILVSPQKVYEVMTLLDAGDFTLTHGRIYEACAAIANRGGLPDISAVANHLQGLGTLEKVGGMAYLSECCDSEAMVLRDTCKQVRDHGHRRRLLKLCDISTRALRSGDGIEACMSEMESGLLNIRANSAQSQIFHIKDFAMKVVEDLFEIKKCGHELVGLSTGVRCIDGATTGIRPGELWIVGALPGRGKTALGVQLAIANAQAGVPTLVFSLEMAKELVYQRILAAKSGVSASKIRNPEYLTDADFSEMQELAARSMEWPMYVDESSQLTANELMARAKLYVRRFGVKLIVADYLRLIKSPGKELREQVANSADCLRRIAKDENVAVVGLSQLRRPDNINDRPTMLHLKESGDIEAAAHVCLLLYQPTCTSTGEFTGLDEIIIGKQRNGPLGSEPVTFSKHSLQFVEREGS
jgi:replicative DNA helicase